MNRIDEDRSEIVERIRGLDKESAFYSLRKFVLGMAYKINVDMKRSRLYTQINTQGGQ
jgi:hypothetical protein